MDKSQNLDKLYDLHEDVTTGSASLLIGDPIFTKQIAPLVRHTAPSLKNIAKKDLEQVYRISLGAYHQQLLEYLYRQNSLLAITLGHHRNTRGQRMEFEESRFLLQIYNDTTPHKVFRKAVQVGVSEYLVIDSINRVKNGETGLYVLPTRMLSNAFVSDRVDKLFNTVAYYKYLLNFQGRGSTDNKTQKQIGIGSLYFTGAGTTRGEESQLFSSIPADFIRLDELDRIILTIGEDKLSAVYSRLKSSKNPSITECANPRAANVMIDAKYQNSCQWTWCVPCQHCGKWQPLDFFKGLVRRIGEYDYELRDKEWTIESHRDLHFFCYFCEKPLDRFNEKSEWIAMQPKHPIAGYHISRLMAQNTNLAELWQEFLVAIGNPTKLSLFYGNNLGLGYLTADSQIDNDDLKRCAKQGYFMPTHSNDMTVAGIDVHKVFLHVTIAKPVGDKLVIMFIGKVRTEEEIINLFWKYSVGVACFDAMPETRMIRHLKSQSALRHIVYAATFAKTEKFDPKSQEIALPRSNALDDVQAALMRQKIVYPENILVFDKGEYAEQMTSSVRVDDVWIKQPNAQDHFFLSTGYLWIAYNIMKWVFHQSSLEELLQIQTGTQLEAPIPLFGMRTKEDVFHALQHNMVIVSDSRDHYETLIYPALQEAYTQADDDMQRIIQQWMNEFNTLYSLSLAA